jgi:hypothetical protein
VPGDFVVTTSAILNLTNGKLCACVIFVQQREEIEGIFAK